MKTTIPKASQIERRWLVLDAADRPLGRLAVKVAGLLRGRGKPVYTPHIDTGDFVVIVNAGRVRLTGRKEQQKTYQRFSGYRGGLKIQTAAEVRQKHPERMIQAAVKGMLPKNTLSRAMFSRLKVYAGAEHPHAAQQPETVPFEA